MTLASDAPAAESAQPDTFLLLSEPNLPFVRLSETIGGGLLRIDSQRLIWSLNETGWRLLKNLGGANGEPVPPLLLDILTRAEESRGLIVEELLVQTPDLRHITAASLAQDGSITVALRDHTEER